MNKKRIEKLSDDQDDNDLELDYLPSEIYLLPLSERPFFPPQTLPILMSEEIWRDSIEKISDSQDKVAGLILTETPEQNAATAEDFSSI